MADPITIRMGGYGPPTTGFGRALKRIGDLLEAEFGDGVEVKYVWNIMDLGYRAEDILWLVEHGLLTLGYQSSSYLTDRVPELACVALPFLFSRTQSARAAMDGTLGDVLARKIEERVNFPSARLVRERIPTYLESPTGSACASASRRAKNSRSAEQSAGTDIRTFRRGAVADGSHPGDRDDHRRHHRRAGESALEYRDLRRAQISSLPFAEQSFLCFAADLPPPHRI